MANKNDLFDFDETTATNNDNVAGSNIAENCAPSGINNALRSLAAIVKRAVGSQGSAIASAATTDIGAASTALYTTVTGTTTITSLGTVGKGTFRIIEFTGILTLTHNATSLKLPGSVNITTAAGDVGFFVSLGAGNWKCLNYSPISGSVVGGFSSVTATSTTADATAGPDIATYRNSASPADNDLGGRYLFKGRDDAANEQIYGAIASKWLDVSSASEDAELYLQAVVAGALTSILTWGAGVGIGSVTMPGVGKLNVQSEIQVGGVALANSILQRFYTEVVGPQSSSNEIIPDDDSLPASTEGTQLFSQVITPKVSTSRIRIEAHINYSNASGAGVNIVFALFRGTTCICVMPDEVVSNWGQQARLVFEEVSGSTSARTYSLRYGTSTASVTTVNTAATSDFGDKIVSNMTVEEYLP